ncbi:ParB/RepB/Spo0J family partition protein [Fodinicurvata fenggangensis]|uniref:ParB/RepB/Spo0J family partition protein n=1 Tax=Fodinicurvata fenggangensis TaxID=1121830 RepID=UPI00047927DF|nr:ParB/RepB/Spo0J family partition protein [Fodinicurvata fenggangensis]
MSESQSSKRNNLGRGLASLLGEAAGDYADLDRQRANKTVPIEHLHPSRVQPRRHFDEAALDSLAESIKAQGLLQAILVRRHPERPSEYEIIAGERRWRAAQRAQLHEVPILVRELDDGTALELAIVENVQRQDLDPIEEAEGYRRLIDDFSHSQEELSRLIGKSRPHIANTLRLLNLPDRVKERVGDGSLSAGHARALLSAEEPERLAEEVVRRGLTVRDTERLVSSRKAGAGETDAQGKSASATRKAGSNKTSAAKDADTLALERDLSSLLGLKVNIELHGNGEGGVLTVHYDTLDQLDDVLRRLNQTPAQDSGL